MNIEEIMEYINNEPPESCVYLGVDSERYNKNGRWMVDYTLAVVIHHGGNHGCKIFGEVQTENDYHERKDRFVVRLMKEVYKVSELYLKLVDALVDRHVEIHLDINPEEKHASNVVMQQAIGYVRGVCEMTPKVKPEAFAASCVADRLKQVLRIM